MTFTKLCTNQVTQSQVRSYPPEGAHRSSDLKAGRPRIDGQGDGNMVWHSPGSSARVHYSSALNAAPVPLAVRCI